MSMKTLDEIQQLVVNDLKVFRHGYFSGMESFFYRGSSPKRGGNFEETRYRVPSLSFFDGFQLAGNVGGERPSDYARSLHLHNVALQKERVRAVAFGFDIEPLTDTNGRPSETQPNFKRFMDTVVRYANDFLLLHVTDPYKTHAYRYVTEKHIDMSESARISGAVNPFLFGKDGTVYADNVDGYALLEAVEEKRPVVGANILLIGAGGTASSIALEALNRGVGRLVVLNRTEERAHELGRQLKVHYPRLSEEQLTTGGGEKQMSKSLEEYAPDADIVISAATTNPYFTHELAGVIPRRVLFADTNYGDAATTARIARETGHMSIDGGPMVYFGVERAARVAFERKLGRKLQESTLAAVKKEAFG